MSTRRIVCLGSLLVLASTILLAFTRGSSPDVRTRTEDVAGTLRCPVCRDLSVADSTAPLAASMRRSIQRRLEAGATEDAVRAYFVRRYGVWILLEPEAGGIGTVARLAPLVALLVAAAVARRILRGRRPTRGGGRRGKTLPAVGGET